MHASRADTGRARTLSIIISISRCFRPAQPQDMGVVAPSACGLSGSPLMYLLSVTWSEARAAGARIDAKLILNASVRVDR